MPQYLLFCDAILATSSGGETAPSESRVGNGRWHFVLERLDEPERFEAVDTERDIHRDRLALLALVRGLEAIEHGGLVRLITTSRYVDRGLRYGLPTWRDTDYHWESFGKLAPIRNADLWKRINVAMQFHDITSRLMHGNFMSAERRRLPAAWRTDRARTDRGHSSISSGQADRGHSQADRGHSSLSSVIRQRRADRGCWSDRGHSTLEVAQSESEPQRVQWWEMAATWVQTARSAPHGRVSLLTV
jgi:ribonuclease HI